MAAVWLVGLLSDGSNPAPGIPLDPRTPIRTQLGGTLYINLQVYRPNGTQVPLSGGSLVLTIKPRPQNVPATITLTGTLQPQVAQNAVQFKLTSAASKTLQPGRYLYDVVFQDAAGNRDAVIPLSAFYFEAAVTPPQ
jgi:hypothetical protein